MSIEQVLEYRSGSVLQALAGGVGKCFSIECLDFVLGSTVVSFTVNDEHSVIMQCRAEDKEDIEKTMKYVRARVERSAVV